MMEYRIMYDYYYYEQCIINHIIALIAELPIPLSYLLPTVTLCAFTKL